MQQPPSTAVQSALTNLLAGTAGGVAVTIVGHPLDTIKTLLQNQPPASGTTASTKNEAKMLVQNKSPASAATPQRYSGLVDCARQVWRAEGLSGLYKGVASPLAFQMLFRAVTFVVFDLTQTTIVALREPSAPPQPPGERVCLSPTEAFAAGAVTGLFGSLVESPIDLLKTKMQIQMMQDHQGNEKGTWTGARAGAGAGAGVEARVEARVGSGRQEGSRAGGRGVRGGGERGRKRGSTPSKWKGTAETLARFMPMPLTSTKTDWRRLRSSGSR